MECEYDEDEDGMVGEFTDDEKEDGEDVLMIVKNDSTKVGMNPPSSTETMAGEETCGDVVVSAEDAVDGKESAGCGVVILAQVGDEIEANDEEGGGRIEFLEKEQQNREVVAEEVEPAGCGSAETEDFYPHCRRALLSSKTHQPHSCSGSLDETSESDASVICLGTSDTFNIDCANDSANGNDQRKDPAILTSPSAHSASSMWNTEAASTMLTETIPAAARELLSTAFRHAIHSTRVAYATGGYVGRYRRHTDLGNAGGYLHPDTQSFSHSSLHLNQSSPEDTEHQIHQNDAAAALALLPPFSSLSWVDRQLVREWRTCDFTFSNTSSSIHTLHPRSNSSLLQEHDHNHLDNDHNDEFDFERARTAVPRPARRPPRENATSCHACRRLFHPALLLRHHCRLCGRSYCHDHSRWSHRLPHLGYDVHVPERVCETCKSALDSQNLAERITWRLTRCRDFLNGDLTPYFDTGVDTVEDAAARLAKAAIAMARSIPLGAQAHVAVETVEVLHKHGLKGVYALVLRKEFMAAADLLCRVTGINKRAWPLSVHELSAAIFYALAQHRAMRGNDPEREYRIHTLRQLPNQQQPQSSRGTISAGSNITSFRGYVPAEPTTKQRTIFEDSAGAVSSLASTTAAATTTIPWTTPENQENKNDSNFATHDEKQDNDDDAGDVILWEGPSFEEGTENHLPDAAVAGSQQKTFQVLDETDDYDPMAESVANILEMADCGIHAQRHQDQTHNCGTPTPNTISSASPSYPLSTRQTSSGSVGSALDTICENHDALATDQSSLEHHEQHQKHDSSLPFTPVCDAVPDSFLSSLIFYAPLALNFIYAQSEVDMQLLAAQQGWRLLYAHLDQDDGAATPPNRHKNNSRNIAEGGVKSKEGNSSLDAVPDRPASALFVHTEQRIACLTIRGTATINDVVTDIRAMPVPFPEADSSRSTGNDNGDGEDWMPVVRGQGLALCGMARASTNLFHENIDALVYLVRRGYRIRITGHSLGGGVAALLGSLILQHLERFVIPDDSNNLTSPVPENHQNTHAQSDWLRVYGYGTPACVDAKLSDYAQSYVTNCVLHDDVVPRLTPTSIRCLLKHLLHIRETWVKAHLADDIFAYTERARLAWAPRWREGFTLGLKTRSKTKKKKVKLFPKKKIHTMNSSSSNGGQQRFGWEDENSDYDGGDNNKILTRQNRYEGRSSADGKNSVAKPGNHFDDDATEAAKNEAVCVDGDEFFEAEENLIESDDDVQHNDRHNNTSKSGSSTVNQTDDWVPFDEPPILAPDENTNSHPGCADTANETKNGRQTNNASPSSPAVILEETPLPRMFIPGHIVHIYTHRGAYKAAMVPRAFRELRRISLAGNMLSDHTSRAYYEALLEVKTVRNAPDELPLWTGFDEDCTCSCCASRFTWASTSDTEAQEARDKHNCRSCGGLVCNPCSSNRVPLASLGITMPVRVCDRCYNDLGGVLTEGGGIGLRGNGLTRSFVQEDEEMNRTNMDSNGDNESNYHHHTIDAAAPENTRRRAMSDSTRQSNSTPKLYSSGVANTLGRKNVRRKRSHVVDELASRIPSTPMH